MAGHPQLNPAFSFQGAVALYIEGIRCHAASVRMLTEEGAVPYLNITVPATAELRHVTPRARVHLIAVEPAPPYNVIVLGEYEISERGFDKSSDERNLTFAAVHVTSHLDQYQITALDTATAIRALGSATEAAGTQVSTLFTGNILELITPAQLLADLREFSATSKTDTALAAASVSKAAKRGVDEQKLTVRDVVLGTFLLYRKIFRNSRVSDTYTSIAVDMHQLIARFQFPDPALINWTDVYAKLMAQLLLKGPQQAGGAQTFLDVVRGICQFFLYDVSIVPNAESVTKQVQIKPMTHFNAVPHCNVFFPSMTGGVSLQENFSTTPTRLQTTFLPLGVTQDFDLTLFERELTMFAPADLQYLWTKILAATASGTQAPRVARSAQKSLTFVKPADGVPFATQEEDRRGIVPLQYSMPPLLNTVILSQTVRAPRQVETAGLPELPAASAPNERNYALEQQLLSPKAPDRLAKYRAFLCIALGDGRLDNMTFKTASALNAVIRRDLPRNTGDRTQFVPDRITLLPVRANTNEDRWLCGANYRVALDGTIFQVRGRTAHLFTEPAAIPYGLRLEGSTPATDTLLNAITPPVGVSYAEWRAAGEAEAQTTAVVTKNPVDNTWQIVIPASAAAELKAKFEEAARNRSDVSAAAQTPPTGAATEAFGARAAASRRAADGSVIFSFSVTRGEAKLNNTYTVTILAPGVTTGLKPWFFCRESKGTITASQIAAAFNVLEEAAKKRAPTVASTGFVTVTEGSGNERNLVIAVDIGNVGPLAGGANALTTAQLRSLALLVAAINELQVTAVGDGSKISKKSARTLPVKWAYDVFRVSAEVFNGIGVLNGAQAVSSLTNAAEEFRGGLFQDFNKWDKSLTAPSAKIIPLSRATDKEGIDDRLPTPESAPSRSLQQDVAAASAADSFVTQATKGKTVVSVDVPEFTEITKGFLRGFLNYQFYATRVAPRSLNVTLPFHPYVTPGYPALVLDNTGTGYDLVGYVHAVAHDFTPTGAQTTVVLTHTRRTISENAADAAVFDAQARAAQTSQDRARQAAPAATFDALQRESMLPFSKTLTNQFVLLAPINNGTILTTLGMSPILGPNNKPLSNLSIARDPELYFKYLQRLAETQDSPCVIPSTFLPIQLHDLETKLPPLFVYDGGFGLGLIDVDKAQRARKGITDSMRNFSTYAVYVGYNQGADNQSPLLNAEQNFVFADTITELNRTASAIEAYAFNRRGVQRLGQNNLAAAAASLVDYKDKSDAVGTDAVAAAAAAAVPKTSDATVANLPTGVAGVPEQIVVYKEPPIYVNGKLTKAGTVLTFDNTIRSLVIAHNAHVAKFSALPNEEP